MTRQWLIVPSDVHIVDLRPGDLVIRKTVSDNILVLAANGRGDITYISTMFGLRTTHTAGAFVQAVHIKAKDQWKSQR